VVTTICMLLLFIKIIVVKILKHKATILWNLLPNVLKKLSSIKKLTQKVNPFLAVSKHLMLESVASCMTYYR